MRDALREVRPTEFADLVALVALYRPGPMAFIST
jgi:DNA polymerase-3 subunit alpha